MSKKATKKQITKQQKPDIDTIGVEAGTSGLAYSYGTIEQEFLSKLKGEQGRKSYREMAENDPVVSAVLFVIEMLIRQVDWRVEPASANPRDKQAAEFLESCLIDMDVPLKTVISEALSMLVYGFDVHEIVYKVRSGPKAEDDRFRSRFSDNKIGWRKFAYRSQLTINRWELSDNGDILGCYQTDPNTYREVFIPIEKFLLFRTTARGGNPEGRSILRGAFRPWFFKKRIEEIEAIGIERDLAGLPIAYVPPELLSPDATPAEKATLDEIKNIIRNVRQDEQAGVIFPLAYDERGNKMFEFSLISSTGKKTIDTNAVINRYDQRIAMTVLADFILLGHEKVGSFALASSKTDIFAVALGAWLDEIADVFNQQAIPRLFELNGWELEELPQIVHGDVETPDLKELGDYIVKLASAGVALFPDEELERYLRRIAGLPAPKEEE